MNSKPDLRSANGIPDQALNLLLALDAETGGPFQHWRSLGILSEYSMDAVQLAVSRGWLLLEGGHTICVTDEGRGIIRNSHGQVRSVGSQGGRSAISRSFAKHQERNG